MGCVGICDHGVVILCNHGVCEYMYSWVVCVYGATGVGVYVIMECVSTV